MSLPLRNSVLPVKLLLKRCEYNLDARKSAIQNNLQTLNNIDSTNYVLKPENVFVFLSHFLNH